MKTSALETFRSKQPRLYHSVVDNGHFGVAALQLLGRDRQAEEWVRTVVDRFREGIMLNVFELRLNGANHVFTFTERSGRVLKGLMP